MKLVYQNTYRRLKAGFWSCCGPVSIIVSIITIIGAIIRFTNIGKLSLWGDEIDTMLFVSRNIPDLFRFLWPKEMNMSDFYVIIHYWQYLFVHPTDGELRIIPALFSVVSIPLVFFLGRKISEDRWIGNATGIIAALFVTFNAFHIQYAQELRSYSLTFLLATLSSLLLINAIKKPRSFWLWLGYVVTCIAGMYSHDFFAFLLVAQALSLIVLIIGDWRSFPYVQVILSFLIIGILSSPMIYAAYIVGPGTLSWVVKPTVDSVLGSIFNIIGYSNMLLLMLYLVAACVDFFIHESWSKKTLNERWIFVLFALSLFLPIGTVLAISMLKSPIFVDRYFLMSLPFITILGAFGIARILKSESFTQKISGVVLGLLILFCTISGLLDFYDHYNKEDWRDTASFLTTQCSDSSDLRLYYPAWTAKLAPYYNNQLTTQDSLAQGDLYNIKSKAIEDRIFSSNHSYVQICLTMSQGTSLADLGTSTPSLIQTNFPVTSKTLFPSIKIYIFKKATTTISQK